MKRRLVPLVVALGTVVGLFMVIQPAQVVSALRGVDLRLVGAALLATAAFYTVQGLRWHFLLREAGVRLAVHESVLINLAGQTVTAVLPLGDLTRALFASEATGAPFGAAAAAVTVQELTFTSLLILSATPALLGVPGGWLLTLVVLGGVVGALLILIMPGFYRPVRALLGRIPLVRRGAGQIDTLRQQTMTLLTRPVAMLSGIIDLARVALAAVTLDLILGAMGVRIGWWPVVLAVAVAYLGGAISFLPGGIGANEVTVIGVLSGFGVGHGQAVAAALLERIALTGVPAVVGLLAYVAIHRRLHLGGLIAAPRAARVASAGAGACEAAA
ncbi:MAG TPA: lysylphosphatidylglycerol synthase transmembrane domain-containing protein [Candidatus Binatia bacterium]|nr:lysylphosphatidylglycerol synthase transmembrane domain-containing protein [Candidatus Binatia bacterium]